MSTLPRTLRNLWKVGIKDYGHQLHFLGDTKAGVLVAKDKYGNSFYENNEELPARTRWVDYKDANVDPSQIEPGWHAWLHYIIQQPPSVDPLAQTRQREWEPKTHQPNMTASRGAYRCYNTTRAKHEGWVPRVEGRGG